MDLREFESGSVRRRASDGLPIRILVCADGMTQYDVWQRDEDAWRLHDLKDLKRKDISYYVMTVAAMGRTSEFSGRDPLTPQEAEIHRPDLPFTIVRSETQAWSDVDSGHMTGPEVIAAPELFLRPFTSSGSRARMERVQAEDAVSFTRRELVLRGQAMLAGIPVGKKVVEGVGIHRLGVRQGIPSYYLWGFQWKGAQPGQ